MNGKNLSIFNTAKINPEARYYRFYYVVENQKWVPNVSRNNTHGWDIYSATIKGSEIITSVLNFNKDTLSGITPYFLYVENLSMPEIVIVKITNARGIIKSYIFVEAEKLDNVPNMDTFADLKLKLPEGFPAKDLEQILHKDFIPFVHSKVRIREVYKKGSEEAGMDIDI